MSLLYGVTGTTNLAATAAALAEQGPSLVLVLAVVLVGAGMGFKIAAVPFHMWAPDVYEGAPTPVTAFLSVGSKAASFAMLIRIFLEGLPSLGAEWTFLFYLLAVVTMTVGNIAALTQSNLKRLLAYSSIAHAGYLLIGVIVGTERGVAAMLVYLGVYLFMQLGAFAVVAAMRRSDVIGDELKDLTGLSRRSPMAAFAMLFFMLSLGGIPPTAGVHGEGLAVRGRHRRRLHRAGGDCGRQQRGLAVLLPAGRRVHVDHRRDGAGRLAPRHRTRDDRGPRGRPVRHRPVRPLSAVPLRARRGGGSHHRGLRRPAWPRR